MVDRDHIHQSAVSSDRLVLRTINVAKETRTYHYIGGYIITPIALPISMLVSGVYLLSNNLYHFSEEKITCDDKEPEGDKSEKTVSNN